jgi:hypothetical protein
MGMSDVTDRELTRPDARPDPARPERLTVEFYEQDGTLAIHKKRGGGPGIFLLLWLIGWTVGCVFLLGMAIKDPAIGNVLFAVPFWAAWFAVAIFLVWIWFGKETLLLRSSEAIFARRALVTLSSRAVLRCEIREFRECRSSHTENDQYLWGIEMVTLGKPLRFAFRLPDREREWLIFRLNQFLATTPGGRPDSLPAEPTPENAIDEIRHDDRTSDESSGFRETLTVENALLLPPTDCRWRLTEDIDALIFSQRGRLHLATVGGLLLVNLFWNGIVSLFVLALLGGMPLGNAAQGQAPQGWEWWGLFVFLIPFEAIGLLMLVGLAFALLEPFRRTHWRLEQQRVVRRTDWPLYYFTRTWEQRPRWFAQ